MSQKTKDYHCIFVAPFIDSTAGGWFVWNGRARDETHALLSSVCEALSYSSDEFTSNEDMVQLLKKDLGQDLRELQVLALGRGWIGARGVNPDDVFFPEDITAGVAGEIGNLKSPLDWNHNERH